MKLCNDNITVFNARLNARIGGTTWIGTNISGVSWWATDASAVDTSKGGLVAANKATIRIPAEADAGRKSYTDPISYKAADDVTDLWTLQDGDIIVHGAIPTETEEQHATPDGDITVYVPIEYTAAQLKRSYESVVVLGVTDNRRAPQAPHFKVVAT